VKSTPTESRVVTVIERPRVVRLAPAKGYLLVNQPPGVRFAYAGETPDYYRVQLAENYYGYVKKTDSKLSSPNIAEPQGEVSTIIANDFPDRVEISMAFGDKLPFRISEQGDILLLISMAFAPMSIGFAKTALKIYQANLVDPGPKRYFSSASPMAQRAILGL
jgi:hypothetical protein